VSSIFHSKRELGIAVHSAAILALLGLAGWGMWHAARASIGPTFLTYLLPALLALALVPALAYRAYALYTATYILEREVIRLKWGLRVEEIPMTRVLWVRLANELDRPLPLPWLRLPGSILGARRSVELGEVEFLAGSLSEAVVISTQGRAFVISPNSPADFLKAYHRMTELGSLTPYPPRSSYPSFLLARVWSDRLARSLLLAGMGLSLLLLIWVSLAIPSQGQISLGFLPDGSRRDLVPAVRLLLLPVLNTIIVLIDFFLGLFFYRRRGNQPLAYLLWTSGVVVPALFVAAVFFLMQTG
jgi:hypothetical protein